MRHEHGIDNAVNIHLLDPVFVEAMQPAWSAETCWGGCKDDYPENRDENPSFGNCLLTTLAAWADRDFIDDVVPCYVTDSTMKNAWHFILRIGTVDVDPTAQQFKRGYERTELASGSQDFEDVIYGSFFEPGEHKSLIERLDLLLEGMQEAGYQTKYSAQEIVQRLCDSFAPQVATRLTDEYIAGHITAPPKVTVFTAVGSLGI